ncbi:MAG: hypothetical protein IPJ85_05220 [Flavobacteriales bacterium]|nr:hypothetical protein [Flavobacteriales bacterium]
MRFNHLASAAFIALVCRVTPAMGQFPLVDISLQHDQLNAQLRVHLRAK